MPPKASPEKDKMVKDILNIIGIQVDLTKLSVEDLKKIQSLLSTPSEMIQVMARAAKLKWSSKPIGELFNREEKGGILGLGFLPIGGRKSESDK